MMTDTSKRRSLEFQDLEEVVRDIRALHEHGFTPVGQWDLAQVCGHLNDWMRYPMDGFPAPPLPMRWMMWGMRKTVGPRMLRKIISEGKMKSGGPTLRATIPVAGDDETKAVEQLEATVRRLQAHQGPIHASPVFGTMDRETLVRLQLIHCAHHLSFLLPRS